MTPKKSPKNIEGLFSAKKKIEKEIEDIQKSCKHTTKSLKQVPERLDSSSIVIRWVCDKCSQIIGIPNNDEVEDYLRQ